jgi:hypothetical protein
VPEWKDILAALAALVASFAGAWAAFALESRRRKNDVESREIAGGNRAIYTVYSLWNVLEQFRKEVLEPFRGSPDAWLNLAAHPTAPELSDRFQISELQFLIERGPASVFAALLLEEQRVNLALGLIRSRSDIVLNEVFPRMARAGVGIGQSRDQEEVEQILGVDVCHKLREITAALYLNVDEDLASLRSTYDLLRKTMKTLYPKRKFLEIIFDESPVEKQSAA